MLLLAEFRPVSSTLFTLHLTFGDLHVVCMLAHHTAAQKSKIRQTSLGNNVFFAVTPAVSGW